jgi:hypothetical protein
MLGWILDPTVKLVHLVMEYGRHSLLLSSGYELTLEHYIGGSTILREVLPFVVHASVFFRLEAVNDGLVVGKKILSVDVVRYTL